MKRFISSSLLLSTLGLLVAASASAQDRPLRIIVFGAHPDDCEIRAGGAGAMWAAKGHKVKFVSVTNGDIGHWREAGGPLALRRQAEAKRADDHLGVTSEVLDIHDGELMPTLENRQIITRLIREWKADIVLTPRPNDYHPDHRYTAVLVQDSAYMVAVPFFCPETPPLKSNPVFLYTPDSFQKPNPFKPDIAVDISSVAQKKLEAMDLLVSQFYEGGALGNASMVPTDPAKQKERQQTVRNRFERQFQGTAEKYRSTLGEFYGQEKAAKIKYAEAFEICEYGRRPDKEELKKLFPFFE